MNTLEEISNQNIDIVSLEQIIAEMPCLDYETPLLYHMFYTYNHKHLNQDEKGLVSSIINEFKNKQSQINNRNLAYMNKDL